VMWFVKQRSDSLTPWNENTDQKHFCNDSHRGEWLAENTP
jgi:hypothetical protein